MCAIVNEPHPDPPYQFRRFDPIHWVYACWKAVSGVVIVVGASAPTAILGWDTMLPSGKFVAILGLTVAGAKSLDMLFDQTMRRLSEGKTPVPINGNSGHHTEHIKKP